jgi:hypothetical protein
MIFEEEKIIVSDWTENQKKNHDETNNETRNTQPLLCFPGSEQRETQKKSWKPTLPEHASAEEITFSFFFPLFFLFDTSTQL